MFDFVLNLSVHSELLYPSAAAQGAVSEDMADTVAQASELAGRERGSRLGAACGRHKAARLPDCAAPASGLAPMPARRLCRAVGELEQGGADLDWRATVTSAFRSTLASSLA